MSETVTYQDLTTILAQRDQTRLAENDALASKISEKVSEKITNVLNNGISSRLQKLENGQEALQESLETHVEGTAAAITSALPCAGVCKFDDGAAVSVSVAQTILERMAKWPKWVVMGMLAVSFAIGAGCRALEPIQKITQLFN